MISIIYQINAKDFDPKQAAAKANEFYANLSDELKNKLKLSSNVSKGNLANDSELNELKAKYEKMFGCRFRLRDDQKELVNAGKLTRADIIRECLKSEKSNGESASAFRSYAIEGAESFRDPGGEVY